MTEETRRVECKNCGTEFDSPLKFFIRKDGRKIWRAIYYCQRACYTKYFKKVTGK